MIVFFIYFFHVLIFWWNNLYLYLLWRHTIKTGKDTYHADISHFPTPKPTPPLTGALAFLHTTLHYYRKAVAHETLHLTYLTIVKRIYWQPPVLFMFWWALVGWWCRGQLAEVVIYPANLCKTVRSGASLESACKWTDSRKDVLVTWCNIFFVEVIGCARFRTFGSYISLRQFFIGIISLISFIFN